MENIWIVLLVAAVLVGAVILIAKKKKGNKGEKVKPGTPTTQMRPEIEKKLQDMARTSPTGTWLEVKETPQKAMVYSAVAIPSRVLETVDRAAEFSIKLQAAQHPNWTKKKTVPEYEVWFVPADGIAPESKVPFITIGGIMSAGTIVEGDRNAVVLPEHSLIEWADEDYLFKSLVHEMEHWRQYNNDREEYLKHTGYHSHPIFPIPADLLPLYETARQGFVAKPMPPCGFGL